MVDPVTNLSAQRQISSLCGVSDFGRKNKQRGQPTDSQSGQRDVYNYMSIMPVTSEKSISGFSIQMFCVYFCDVALKWRLKEDIYVFGF